MNKLFLKRFSILLTVQFIAGTTLSIHAQTDLPKIIKPSPETSALFRFQDYPMDYSTGLPQISIPIYEVTSGSLTVPISLSYHASGRKVYDQDGPIALGWSLNTGGMISRTVYGSADFGTPTYATYKFPYPFKIDNLTNVNDLAYLQKINHCTIYDCNILPWTDSEYDIFSYSFGNNSGNFLFKDVNNVKTPVFLPYKPFILTQTSSLTGLANIDIVDDKGILYQFVTAEYNTSADNVTSGWVLKKMISADKTDTISFTYTSNTGRRTTITQNATLIDDWVMRLEPFPTTNLTYPETTTEDNYQTSRISQIDFNQGKVKFNLATGTDKIDNIQILNVNNEVLKTIQFTRSQCYSQSELGTARNKLDALSFKDKAGTAIENYAFEYYPVISSNGQVNVRYCDWWGYYNNSGVHDMVPAYNVYYVGSGGPGTIDLGNSLANREPSLEAMKSGVLKKITYPGGGNTEFAYENNKGTLYGSATSPRNGPGMRIYQIKSADNNGLLTSKTYKYGINESGNGDIGILPDITTMASEMYIGFMDGPPGTWTPERAGKYRQRIFYSNFISELSAVADRPVLYKEITEYHGTEASNTGKTVFNYDYVPWAPSGMPTLMTLTFPKKHIFDFNYWNNASLISKSDFKRTNAVYKKIKEVSNNYATTVTENIRGLHVQREISIPQTGFGSAIPPGGTTEVPVCSELYAVSSIWGNLFGTAEIYTFSGYQIPAGYKNLMSTSETSYTDNNTSITNSVSYEYNSRQLVSKTTTTSSENTSIVNDTKYPIDYTGNSLLSQMVGLNMLSYPVEQIETNNGTHINSVKTNYFNWGTTPPRIAPQTVEVKVASGSYETRLRYSSYDSEGNPTVISKENDQLISYVWGYSKTYPIAEVANSAVKNIFHTSFEDGDGNSTLNDCKTGRKSRTGGYSKSLSGLDNGSYILSYWQKSGANWVLQSSFVSVTSGTYAISLTGQVDEVRFYPKTSQMKTYTYDPLIGVLTECDASDRVSYYEYDNYSRLKLIRDINGNILKTFKYQYQGTSPN